MANVNKMRPADFSHRCNKCGIVYNITKTDEDSECRGCYVIDKADSVDELKKEINHLRDELESVRKHNKDDIKQILNMLADIKIEQNAARDMIVGTFDDIKSHTNNIKRIKENGVPLNKENIKIVKKIAKKVAIQEIVDWESD
jgi:Glu-tRNA(Gln) amidotransferase subunit E-like FAD-binding protein